MGPPPPRARPKASQQPTVSDPEPFEGQDTGERGMSRLLSAFCAGALAMFVMKALGVPFWLYGLTYGDQADAFLMAAYLTWLVQKPRTQP